jgi:hypothetical protein
VEWQLQIVRKFYRSLMELVLSPTQHWIFKVKVKAKVKLSLCFNWASRHKGVLGERRYSSTHYLTSALDGGEWSSSHPGLFTPRARAPGTHWTRGWVGPRAVLDAVVKRKIPSRRRESNPRTPIVQPVAQRYTDWAVTALGHRFIESTCSCVSVFPFVYFPSTVTLNQCTRISWNSVWMSLHRKSLHLRTLKLSNINSTNMATVWILRC